MRDWQNLPVANRTATPIGQYLSKNGVASFSLRNLKMTFTMDFITSIKAISLPPNNPNFNKISISFKIENGSV